MVATYRGKVTRVTAEGVYVEIPTIAPRNEFGPLGCAVADPPVGAPVAVTSIENVADDFVVIAVLPQQSASLQGHLEHIANGTFDSDLSGWADDAGASSAWAVPGVAVVTVPFTGPSNDGVFYQQDLTLVSSYTYTVRFKVRASLPGNMDVVIRKQVSPFTSYFSQTVAVTTSDQTLAYTFVAAATLEDAEIRFELDGLSEDWVVVLDGISLKGGPIVDVIDSSTVDFSVSGDLATKRLTASVIPAGLIGSLSLDNLSDVTVSAATTGHILRHNGTTWINVMSVLDLLDDVAISSPATGHILRHNGTQFVNIQSVLDLLDDVAITSPGTGALLRYNGTTWVNVAVLDLIAAAAGTDQFTVRVTGDSQPRLVINGDGKIEWGDGTSTPSVNLYKSGAILKTDQGFTVVGAFNVGTGPVEIDPAAPTTYEVLRYNGTKFASHAPGPEIFQCTSQLDKNNTTMSDIPGLAFSVTTEFVYYVVALIAYSGPTAGDIKFDWDFTGIVSADITRWTLGSQLGTTTNQNTAVTMARRDGSTDVSVGADNGAGSGQTAYTEHIIISPSANGTVQMRAAQDTASGTSSVFTQSRLVVFRGYLGN